MPSLRQKLREVDDVPDSQVFPSDGIFVHRIVAVLEQGWDYDMAHARLHHLGCLCCRRGEVIAVLIHCDAILYLALLVGLVRAGFVVSLTSTLPKRTSA